MAVTMLQTLLGILQQEMDSLDLKNAMAAPESAKRTTKIVRRLSQRSARKRDKSKPASMEMPSAQASENQPTGSVAGEAEAGE